MPTHDDKFTSWVNLAHGPRSLVKSSHLIDYRIPDDTKHQKMMSQEELSEIITLLLNKCDRNQMAYISGRVMRAALETYPAEERHRVLTDAMQSFRRLLPELDQ